MRESILKTAIALLCICAVNSAIAQSDEAAELARQTQNPVADLISLPLQLNMNYGAGPDDDLQQVLNIQPVWPLSLNDDWNLITRTILPIISQPDFGTGLGRENGIGDIQFSAFLSPKQGSGGWIWGAGAIAQLDTAGDDRLGQGVWGLGPTAVALTMRGPWVAGALVNNVWSVSRSSGRSKVNQFLMQPFINYNFPNSPGRSLNFSPIITANWEASSGQRWTIPLGLGIGQVTKFGNQAVNLSAQAYYNVERPDQAARWQIRLQVAFLFPK